MTTATQTRRTPKDVLIIGTISALILLMFPLLAVTGLALQFGFVLALPLALVALLLMPMLRKIRVPQQEVEVQGIKLPGDVYLHERHAWARRSRRGRYQVGADALLTNAFSAVDAVDLPEPGTRVEQGTPLVVLRGGDRELTLKAPFTGTVQRVNKAVQDETSLLQDAPYGKGWLVELTPEAGVHSLDGLRDSATARPWLTHEIDRMLALLTEPHQAMVLADGGELGQGYAAELKDDAWKNLSDRLF